MNSLHKLKITLIKIRFMADISRDMQCKTNELHIIMAIISELADHVLEEDEQDHSEHQNVISDDENCPLPLTGL